MRATLRTVLLALGLAATAAGCGEKQHYVVDMSGNALPADDEGRPLAGADTSAGAAGTRLSGVIDLAADLDVDPAEFAAVFVLARRPGGRSNELVRKLDAPRFPLAFELTAADAMHSEGLPAGGYEIVARLDHDGDAPAEYGDVQGVAADLALPDGPAVKIVLNQVLSGDGQAPHPSPESATTQPSTQPAAQAPGHPPFASDIEQQFAEGEGPRIQGTVALDPALADEAAGHALLLILRSKEGRGMPIAVLRIEKPSYPVAFDLGPEHAPLQSDDTPQILLGENKLVARVAVSGSVIGGPEDIESEPVLIKADGPAVTLTLDHRRGP